MSLGNLYQRRYERSGHTEQGEVTVEIVCRDYVADRRREKGDATAVDADKRLPADRL